MYMSGRSSRELLGKAGTSESGGAISAAEGLGARFDLDLGRIGIRLGRTTLVLGLVLGYRDPDPVPFEGDPSGGRGDDVDGMREVAGVMLDFVRVRVIVAVS